VPLIKVADDVPDAPVAGSGYEIRGMKIAPGRVNLLQKATESCVAGLDEAVLAGRPAYQIPPPV